MKNDRRRNTIKENDDSSGRRPHFELNFSQEIVFRFLVMTASAVVIFAGMKAASAIIAPVLIAVFATIILLVPFRWFKSKGFSDFISLFIVIGASVILFLGFGWLVGNSLNDFVRRFPEYKHKIDQEVEKLDAHLSRYGFALNTVSSKKSDPAVPQPAPPSAVTEEESPEEESPVDQAAPKETAETVSEEPASAESVSTESVSTEPVSSEVPPEETAVSEEPALIELDMERIMAWVNWAVSELRHLAENGFLVMIITIFMIFEAARFPEKLSKAFGQGPITNEHFYRIANEIRRYLLFKGCTNLISTSAVTVFYLCFGVPYALLWGLIAFFLYFIPNIGSVIAAVIPILLVFMESGLNGVLIVVTGLVIIESLIGYGLEPRILGHGLGISTVVVFLSLIFWGWILGPTGLFLAAPLTIMVKIILQAFKETEWIAVLLGDSVSSSPSAPDARPRADAAPRP